MKDTPFLTHCEDYFQFPFEAPEMRRVVSVLNL